MPSVLKPASLESASVVSVHTQGFTESLMSQYVGFACWSRPRPIIVTVSPLAGAVLAT